MAREAMEVILRAMASGAGMPAKPSIGEAKRLLISRYERGQLLAARLGRLSQVRHLLAHPEAESLKRDIGDVPDLNNGKRCANDPEKSSSAAKREAASMCLTMPPRSTSRRWTGTNRNNNRSQRGRQAQQHVFWHHVVGQRNPLLQNGLGHCSQQGLNEGATCTEGENKSQMPPDDHLGAPMRPTVHGCGARVFALSLVCGRPRLAPQLCLIPSWP